MSADNSSLIRQGDRSHPDLVRLDCLKPGLTYPGWHSDFIDAENSRLSEYLTFNDCVFTLEEKQRMFEGNRSHRRLQKLDSQSFSYPGWRADFKRAEEIHTSAETGLAELGFSFLLETMKNKQDTVLHGRSHPDLVLLDNLKTTLSYPGWHSDFTDAENSRLSEYLTFNDCVFTLEEKQRMFEGNRSHRRLQKLDSQSFSYPGWRADFKRGRRDSHECRDRASRTRFLCFARDNEEQARYRFAWPIAS